MKREVLASIRRMPVALLLPCLVFSAAYADECLNHIPPESHNDVMQIAYEATVGGPARSGWATQEFPRFERSTTVTAIFSIDGHVVAPETHIAFEPIGRYIHILSDIGIIEHIMLFRPSDVLNDIQSVVRRIHQDSPNLTIFVIEYIADWYNDVPPRNVLGGPLEWATKRGYIGPYFQYRYSMPEADILLDRENYIRLVVVQRSIRDILRDNRHNSEAIPNMFKEFGSILLGIPPHAAEPYISDPDDVYYELVNSAACVLHHVNPSREASREDILLDIAEFLGAQR